MATDIEIEITASTQYEGQGEEKQYGWRAQAASIFCVRCPKGSEVTLALQEKRLQVKSGKSRFNLQTLPAEDFPRLAAAEGPATNFSVPQKLLKSQLGLVQYAMAQQDIRYYLNGLLMVIEDGQLKLVATDGHRLAFVAREAGAGNLPARK